MLTAFTEIQLFLQILSSLWLISRVLKKKNFAFSVKVAEIGQIRERERRMAFCGKKKLEIFDGILPLEHYMQSSAAGHNRAEMCPLALKQN